MKKFFLLLQCLDKKNIGRLADQRGWGHWAVYYTGPQSFTVFLFSDFITLRILLNFDWLVHKVECPNVLTTIIIYRNGNFEIYINLFATVPLNP